MILKTKSFVKRSSEEELDTISGATVSSQPVVDAINEASTYVDELK
ncbi:FMN-binding domain [Faecalitalea cylindroides T2-87]|uniref:FMN-binding domain n=1 Tax=Faecalitalea cylindroides T2-87 TaxID=717960 RepID=D4JCN9_9FIRM|nr:FMN-binding domain [Faecalitalea cylindroides T2-87]